MPKEKTKKRAKKEEREKSKREEPVKEEVCEIFDVEKNGEETTIKSCGIEEEKKPSEMQIKKEYNIFKIIIITMIGFVLMFLAVIWLVNYFNHITVGGVIFEIDKTTMVGKTIYRTSIPVSYQDGITGKTVAADYNFYFRTDPRILEKIPFEGGINLKKNMVINMTKDFNCNGYGMIAIANLLNLYRVVGTNVIKDENATCDDLEGKYMFLKIEEGEGTYILEHGFNGGCYRMKIKDCEILEGTEKFMLETLIEVNKKVNQ